MRILIFEFITGGGLIGAALPPTLDREGAMMRDALLADVTEVSGVTVVVARDPRCSITAKVELIEPNENESAETFFRRAIGVADVVWPIAPDSELEKLARIARRAGKRTMLSNANTLALCASKFATANALREATVPVVATFKDGNGVRNKAGAWITKPDDGSGAEGIRLWPNSDAALEAAMADGVYPWVFQPWCPGESLSLSLICTRGEIKLLAVNRQHIAWKNGCPKLTAITVNAFDRSEFLPLAQKISQAIPGLQGYIGVDFIRAADDTLKVLEINPRLTTSYCGLRDALGINVARALLSEDNLDDAVIFSRNEQITLTLADADQHD